MSRLQDLTGKKFGMLTVIKRTDDYIQENGRRRVMWLCRCDCGNEVIVYGDNLKCNKTKSCGCLQRQVASKRLKKYNKYDLSGCYGVGYTFKDEEFYFDLEDYDKIKDYCWYIDKDGYVKTHNPNDSSKFILLSRLVMGFPDICFDVDHKHGCSTRNDNRKSNLRICTRQQNCMNRGLQSNNTSGITGVQFNKKNNTWMAMIGINGKSCSKSFVDFNDAVRQRRQWENELFGEFSYVNSNKDAK